MYRPGKDETHIIEYRHRATCEHTYHIHMFSMGMAYQLTERPLESIGNN